MERIEYNNWKKHNAHGIQDANIDTSISELNGSINTISFTNREFYYMMALSAEKSIINSFQQLLITTLLLKVTVPLVPKQADWNERDGCIMFSKILNVISISLF